MNRVIGFLIIALGIIASAMPASADRLTDIHDVYCCTGYGAPATKAWAGYIVDACGVRTGITGIGCDGKVFYISCVDDGECSFTPGCEGSGGTIIGDLPQLANGGSYGYESINPIIVNGDTVRLEISVSGNGVHLGMIVVPNSHCSPWSDSLHPYWVPASSGGIH